MNILVTAPIIVATLEAFTAGILLYRFIKLRTTALFLLSLSFFSFFIFSLFDILATISMQHIFPIAGLYAGVVGLFVFIIYCSYVETESLISSKVFFALSLFSIIITVITLDIPKFERVTLSTGENIWILQDVVLYTLLFVFLLYTGSIFFTTFMQFSKKAWNTRHGNFLIGNLAGGLLGIIGGGLNILYMGLMIAHNDIVVVDKLFVSYILMSLYPVSVLVTSLLDVEILWAPSFSLDALYVFHSSGITVFSFNFSEKRKKSEVLITSILSALIVAIKEVTGKTSFINRISLEDRLVYLKKVEDLYFALFCTQPNKSLYNAFLRFVSEFTKTCASDIIVKNKQTIFVRNASRGYEIIKKVFPVF